MTAETTTRRSLPDRFYTLPPGFILQAVCACCGVEDKPGATHLESCPAYPGKRVSSMQRQPYAG